MNVICTNIFLPLGLLDADPFWANPPEKWSAQKIWSGQDVKAIIHEGYVQPIGSKAIPGQLLNQNSTANFGVGAFLPAACEMYRWLDK